MEQVKRQIGWGNAFSYGITGRDVGVAVLDTGVFVKQDIRDRGGVFNDMVRGRRKTYFDK